MHIDGIPTLVNLHAFSKFHFRYNYSSNEMIGNCDIKSYQPIGTVVNTCSCSMHIKYL